MSSNNVDTKTIVAVLAGAVAGASLYGMSQKLSAPEAPSKIKLTYFPLPARAEAARLAFVAGNIPFEDCRVTGDQWKELKSSVKPWGQLPMLEVDGTQVFQSMAILRVAGRIANLIPADVVLEGKVNEIVDSMEDLFKPMITTFKLSAEEKPVARAKLLEKGGDIHNVLLKFEEHLALNAAAYPGSVFVVGNELTIADLAFFSFCSMFTSSWLDGVPEDCLSGFAKINAHRLMVGRIPRIQDWYRTQKDDVNRKNYLVE